jgi:hypothetical protein
MYNTILENLLLLVCLAAVVVAASSIAVNATVPDGTKKNETTVSYGHIFYEIASLGLNRTFNSSSYSVFKKLHLIRVPKAGSTALSVIARYTTIIEIRKSNEMIFTYLFSLLTNRQSAGCEPRGPCCKWPGDPPGSCPARGLDRCNHIEIIGCMNHFSNYPMLLDNSLPSISMVREPISRAISAFFYPGIHHNSGCTGLTHGSEKKEPTEADVQKCFPQYLQDRRFQNPAVKLFSGGEYAYTDIATCMLTSECPQSLEEAILNLDRFDFMGVSELWELSMLVFHMTFPQIKPLLDDFLMSPSEGDNSNDTANGQIVRYNNGSNYRALRTLVRSDKYHHMLAHQNRLDTVLYEVVTMRLCDFLHEYKLWDEYEYVRTYWHEKSLVKSSKCP